MVSICSMLISLSFIFLKANTALIAFNKDIFCCLFCECILLENDTKYLFETKIYFVYEILSFLIKQKLMCEPNIKYCRTFYKIFAFGKLSSIQV